MNLNKEQIEKVIDWMNTWEQLKNTAIPLRLKEEFMKQLTLTDVSQQRELLHKLLQHITDEGELTGYRTHDQIIDDFYMFM